MTKTEILIQVGAPVLGFLLTAWGIIVSRQAAKKKSLELDPFLVSYSGKYGDEAIVQFRNDGGPMRKLSVEPNGDFHVSFAPPDSIPADCEGKITITNYDDSKEYRFRLRYETKANEARRKTYVFSNRKLHEVKGR